MTNRMRVASFIAILAIGSLFAAVDASARGGGGAAGRAGAFHAPVHAPLVRPHARVAPFPGRAHAAPRVAKFDGHFRHGHKHHHDGNGSSVIYFGSIDDFPAAIGPDDVPQVGSIGPTTTLSETQGPELAVAGQICHIANQVVPRERGGATTVRITRCSPQEQ